MGLCLCARTRLRAPECDSEMPSGAHANGRYSVSRGKGMREKSTEARSSLWRGLVAGAAAGAVGSLCMSGYQHLSNKLTGQDGGGRHSSRAAGGQASQRQPVPGTVRAADLLARRLLRRPLRSDERPPADSLVHFAFGVVTGAAYGAAAEFAPALGFAAGVPFGAAVWLAADEIAVPAMGLAKPAWRNPPRTHAHALAAHVLYGLGAELTRRALLRLLTPSQDAGIRAEAAPLPGRAVL